MCGVAGVFEAEGASGVVADMLFAIQHRGQESCGAAVRDASGRIFSHRGMGLVKNVLDEEVQARLAGSTAIGHVRYPTAGCSDVVNAQPHAIELAQGPIMAVSSNGDLINYGELRARLEAEGVTFKSDNDAELIGRLIAMYHVRGELSIEDSIARAQDEMKGAFSTLLMFRDRLYAFRDPHGFRPLVMGHLGRPGQDPPASEGTVFASESCSFGIVGATSVREVLPGEILRLERGRPVERVRHAPLRPQHCVFELIYFSRPDSEHFGETVYQARERIGACLAAKDADLPGDDLVVIPVPDSSNFVALGYAKAKRAEFGLGLLRNHYVGRTFIKPTQLARDEGVKQKFNPLPGFFPGRRVVLVDDSIVRGTSLRKIVAMIRRAGAREIHVRIGSPPVVGPCYYGIDTPTREELVANRMDVDGIRAYLGADSLAYLEVADFEDLLPGRRQEFCTACFDLDYIYPPAGFASKSNAPAASC